MASSRFFRNASWALRILLVAACSREEVILADMPRTIQENELLQDAVRLMKAHRTPVTRNRDGDEINVQGINNLERDMADALNYFIDGEKLVPVYDTSEGRYIRDKKFEIKRLKLCASDAPGSLEQVFAAYNEEEDLTYRRNFWRGVLTCLTSAESGDMWFGSKPLKYWDRNAEPPKWVSSVYQLDTDARQAGMMQCLSTWKSYRNEAARTGKSYATVDVDPDNLEEVLGKRSDQRFGVMCGVQEVLRNVVAQSRAGRSCVSPVDKFQNIFGPLRTAKKDFRGCVTWFSRRKMLEAPNLDEWINQGLEGLQ